MKSQIGIGTLLVAVLATSTASAATTVTTNAQNEVTYDVTPGDTYVEKGAFSSAIAKVTKTGGGTLELAAAHPDFKGKVFEIIEGVVTTAQKVNPLGTSTAKVLSGAALYYTGDNPGQTTSNFEAIEIVGDGPDGLGAFRRTTKGYGDQLIKKLTLTGNATIGGTTRFGVYEIDLAGFTLTIADTSGDPFMLLNATVRNPGSIVHKSKRILMQGVMGWGNPQPDTSTWTMALDDAELSLYSGTVAFPWHVVASNPFKVTVGSALQVMEGPMDLNGKTVTFANGDTTKDRTIEVRGDIRGGSVLKTDEKLTLRLVDADHDLTQYTASWGQTVITGGVFHALAKKDHDFAVYNGASLSMADAGRLCTTQAPVYVYNSNFSADNHKPSRLDLIGQTHWTQLEPSSFTIVQIGGKRDSATGGTGWGVMSVADGATVTNGFSIAPKGRGALYVKNGSAVYSRSGFWLDVAGDYSSGGYRYGFLGVDGSRFDSWGGFRMGVHSQAEGHAVFHGGGFHLGNESVVVGHSGYGNFYASDGTVFSRSANRIAVTLGARAAGVGGEGVFTLDNCTTAMVARICHKSHTNFIAQVNVNGGSCLGVREVWYAVNSSTGGKLAAAEGARSVFSFDGGTVDYFTENESANLFADKPDRAFVHAGGLTVNVATQSTVVVTLPLTRPVAKSFKSISRPTDAAFLSKKFIGPVRIQIEGSGEGATAFIDFDTKTETLGDVVITSKGSGYDETTKVFAVPQESPTEKYECAYELQEEVGGDFVKTGPGALCLDYPNTYGGMTVVDGGFLYARADYALPSNTAVRVNNGATLNLFGMEAKISSVGGNGGFINGAKGGGALTVDTLDFADAGRIECFGVSKIIVTGTMKVDCRDLIANRDEGQGMLLQVNVEFAPTAKIEFSHVEALDENVSDYAILSLGWNVAMSGAPVLVDDASLGGRWRFRTTPKGMSLHVRRGLALIVR